MAINRLVQQLCREEEVGFVGLLCLEGWVASTIFLVSNIVESRSAVGLLRGMNKRMNINFIWSIHIFIYK